MKLQNRIYFLGFRQADDSTSGEVWYYDGPAGMTRGVRFDKTGTVLRAGDATGAKSKAAEDDESAVYVLFCDVGLRLRVPI